MALVSSHKHGKILLLSLLALILVLHIIMSMHYSQTSDTAVLPHVTKNKYINHAPHSIPPLSSLRNDTIHLDDDPPQQPTTLIFQIGFNKCATKSLMTFFRRNRIKALHWKLSEKQLPQDNSAERKLSRTMYLRYQQHQPVLLDFAETYQYYGDFGVFVQKDQDQDILLYSNDSYLNQTQIPWYTVLLEQYPNSVYILNIRNVLKWLRSRWHHYFLLTRRDIGLKKRLGINDRSSKGDLLLLDRWRSLWYDYLCAAIRYFQVNDMMDRLLVFDIETDQIEKMTIFFQSNGFSLNSKYWGTKSNAAQYKPRNETRKSRFQVLWDKLRRDFPTFFEENNHEPPLSESVYLEMFCSN